MNFRGLSHEQLKSCLKKQDPTLHILADALCEQQVSGNDLINMTAEDVNIVFPYSFPLRKALLEFIKERKSLYSAEHYLISKKGKTKASGPQKMFSAIARSIMIKYMVWRNGMFKKSIDWKPITKEIVDCLPELRGMEREIERRCSCMLQNRRDYLRRVANGTAEVRKTHRNVPGVSQKASFKYGEMDDQNHSSIKNEVKEEEKSESQNTGFLQ